MRKAALTPSRMAPGQQVRCKSEMEAGVHSRFRGEETVNR
jgi:hypothetical protein